MTSRRWARHWRSYATWLRPRVFDPAHDALTVCAAVSDYVQSAMPLDFTPILLHEALGVRLVLGVAAFPHLGAQIDKDDVDLAVIMPKGIRDTLRTRLPFEGRYVFIDRRGHPALRRPQNAQRFCAIDHVMVLPRGGSFSTPVDTMFDAQGLQQHVVLSASTFHFVLKLAGRSDLVGTSTRAHGEGRLPLPACAGTASVGGRVHDPHGVA